MQESMISKIPKKALPDEAMRNNQFTTFPSGSTVYETTNSQ
jgi:hypothetical protein